MPLFAQPLSREERLVRSLTRMRFGAWAVFFLVCNVLGVQAFSAALTLPLEEALVPGALTVPLIGLTAFGATRVMAAWKHRDE